MVPIEDEPVDAADAADAADAVAAPVAANGDGVAAAARDGGPVHEEVVVAVVGETEAAEAEVVEAEVLDVEPAPAGEGVEIVEADIVDEEDGGADAAQIEATPGAH
jgi:hypothetical protein